MKEKLIAVKERINSFNGRRNENSRKYKMTNLLLTVYFRFYSCMAEINQAKKPAKFILFVAERPSVMLFNILIASLIFYGLMLLFKKAGLPQLFSRLSIWRLV